MPTAIVLGATGILGRAIVHELGRRPEWTQIHALSRSKKEAYPATVVHRHVDLQGSVDQLARELQGVEADHVFFAAYLAAPSEQEHDQLNGPMLANFLAALRETGAEARLQRLVLVTGAKQYGLQFGRTKLPMEESDPWIDGSHRPPNFYYTQQRILHEASAQASWDWVVTYPNDVLGFAQGNFMNLTSTLGIYCAVVREMGGPKAFLDFPGSPFFYTAMDCYTDADLHARFCVWAAAAPAASRQGFNVVNGDVDSWQNMWPKLAQRFGLTVDPDMMAKAAPEPQTSSFDQKPPIEDLAAPMGLRGVFGPSKTEQRIPLVKWSQRRDVQEAWDRLAKREGLEHDAFEKATWAFLDFVLGRDYDVIISSNKARKAGWNEFQDTWESFEKCFAALEQHKILPVLPSK